LGASLFTVDLSVGAVRLGVVTRADFIKKQSDPPRK
jgi:hypothetical protein